MSIFLLWLPLAGAAGIILVASTFLAKSADVIAFKTGLGRAFIGVVLLATATSLPELGTGVSSIVLFDEPDLAAGDAFGSNLFNLLIIGLLDLYWRNGPILNSVSMTSAIVGALGIAVISLAAIAVLIHGMTSSMSTWYVSPFSVVTFLVFLVAMYMIYRFDRRSQQEDAPDSADEAQESGEPDEHEYANASMSRAAITYVLAGTVEHGDSLGNRGTLGNGDVQWMTAGSGILTFHSCPPCIRAKH